MFRIDFFDEVFLEFFYHVMFVLMGSLYRGGSSTAATFKVKRFVIIVNGWKPLNLHLECCSSPRSTSALK